SSAEPPDLVDRLLERGLVHDKEPYAVALVLTREPPPPPDGVIAKRVETFEEYAAANAVQWDAFDMPESEIDELRPQLPQMWSETVNLMHIASVDGEVVAAGTSAPTKRGLLLYGGATRPSARGRGAYRAVLHARWQDAVANGTPALVTQAGSMSRPILERLGFERVGEVHMLLDLFGESAE
ncbi:MAG: GNAT family N-acetyltransferase, partial [Gaiellaceae bacterium]